MKLVLLTFTMLWACFAHAGIIEWTNSIHTPHGGTPVEIGQPQAKDSINAEIPTGTYTDVNVLNRISLGIDLHYPQYFGSAMDVAVQVKVKRWDASASPLPDTTFWLHVSYAPSDTLRMIALNKAEFTGAYKLVWSIEQITVNGSPETILPANLFVQGDIFIERYRELSATPFSSTLQKTDRDCNGTDDAVTISWNPVTGAEEYQVEWAYINDYADNLSATLPESTLSFDFKFNSTRITTSGLSHTISLVFDRGWLVYRLRAVGVLPSAPEHFVFGPWNAAEKGTVDQLTANKVHITGMEQHEATVNWQYAATYAEQGKHKEIVSYFDGTLRNRQTVTRVNSDNNIIVGETIYDHQGRPTVTVLPVPVADTVCESDPLSGQSIRLYRDFNVNGNNAAYSANDFDRSDTTAICEVGAAPMNTSSGAANYYSAANPKQLMEQGYVPEANGYPFMQVEYTPDNTGRIRRQGGVGPEFQIGSGHETRYLYGQPNQLELDRLFGSEMGHASHYQKNAVIDAHGQASISYLDQQGRVIATALAGDNPANLQGIPSEGEDPVQLEVDAFASGGNTTGMDNRSLVFSSQLLVPYQSEHTFSYALEITPADLECLDSICVDCVYDLTVELIDECGINRAPASLQNSMAGKFAQNAAGYTFHAACSNPLNGTFDTTFTVSLEPGNYSLNKTLTVNQQAIDSLVAIYLRSSCAMTLDDFKDIALAKVDTSGCITTCDDCFEKLGTLEQFIAEGYGNSNDYYLRAEECQQLCQDDVSSCQVMASILQMDLMPGGQYGEYLDPNTGAFAAANFPLSIYNPSNVLAAADWRSPVLTTPQGQQSIYVNANGERSKVYLAADPANPGAWLPEPSDVNLVQTEPETGNHFIYPEQLAHVTDFIDQFEQSWARSLMVYHPEYCYYETCLVFEEPVVADDAFTSVTFDKLLQKAVTIEDAFYSGLLGSNGTAITVDWFTPLGGDHTEDSIAWDPFVYYSTAFNTTSCSGNYGAQLQHLFNNYKYIDGAWRSMPEVAALTARCGTNYASSYPTGCYNFGHIDGSFSIDIINEEWTILKSLYLGEKQKLQRQIADCRAIKECDAYNGCIGNDNYNPIPAMAPYFEGTTLYYPYTDMDQPCSVFKQHLFRNKIKRFSDETDLPYQDANSVAYEVYLQTGQCPVEFTLQSLLSAMAQDGGLIAASITVNDYPQLSGVFQAMNNFNMPGTMPILEHQASISGSVLTAEWTAIPSSPVATLTFTLGGSASWNDVTNIVNLYITGANSFTADAVIYEAVNDTTYIQSVAGTITMPLPVSCEFAPECSSNDLAKHLTTLMNTLVLTEQIGSTSPVAVNPYISPIIGTVSGLTDLYIENAAGVGSNLYWVSISDNLYKIFDPAGNPADGLYIQLQANVPTGFFSTVSHLGNLTSITGNSFEVEAFLIGGGSVTAYGTLYREINGDRTGIKAGDCGLPTPAACQTAAHANFETMQALLNDVLTVQGTTAINLYTSVELTQTFVNSLPWGVTATTSQLSVNGDTLVISAGTCDLVLSVEAPYNLAQLIRVRDFAVTGSPDNYGDFHDFECTGVFYNGVDTLETALTGTSCVGIKECNPCVTSHDFNDGEDIQELLSESATSDGTENFIEEEDLRIYDENLALITDHDSLQTYLYETYMLENTACPTTYTNYLNCLSHYNDSVLAMGSNSGFYLIQDTVLYPIFMQSNFCECMDHFCGRVNQVLSGTIVPVSELALNEFLDFTNFCGVEPIDPVDPCETSYQQYLNCIAYYNSTIDATEFPVTSILEYDAFQRHRMCYCADDFCSRLSNILSGLTPIDSPAELNEYLNPDHCERDQVPCAPAPTTGLPVIMPDTTLNNNCVEMMVNQALFEAQILYQNYVDSISNALINQYMDHCLGAVSETFKYTYNDKLYHYTLYYYDQAGNLIKTIPPEGVERLALTSSYSALSQQIAADRDNRTKTVFTNHRLATRYEYNSLNQLVYQSTPDTDPMDIFELTLPNGLHSELVTYKIQMVNEHVGYLGGEINGAGAMYRTADGGTTWQRVPNLVGADLRKVIMYSANSGTAIGEKGTVVFTNDGGSTWNLYPQLWQVPSLDVIHDLNDIVHIELGGGDRRFIITGENRTVIQLDIVASVPTITMLTAGITEPATASVSSVTTDGSDFFITVNDPAANTASVYRLPFGTATWVAENSFTAGGLKDIDLYSATGAYAAGEDGRMYKKTDATSATERWKLVQSDLVNTIHAIRFFNEQNGVALVELQPGQKYLMRTFTGGASWTQLSENTFNHLSASNNRSHVLAVGDNGVIEIIGPGTTLETIPVASGTSEHLTAGWMDNEVQTNGLSKPHLIVASASGKIRYTANAFTNYPQWTTSDATTLLGADNAIDIRAERSGQLIQGAVLTETGILYRAEKPANSHTVALTSLAGAAAGHKGLARMDALIFSVDKTTDDLVSVSPSTGTYTVIGSLVTDVSSIAGVSGHIIGAGETGGILNAELNGAYTSITGQTDESLATNPNQLYDIVHNSGYTFCAGADGTLYQRATSPSVHWRHLNTQLNETIYSLSVITGPGIIAAGSDGLLAGGGLSGNTYLWQAGHTFAGEAISSVLGGAALYDSYTDGMAFYAVGENGKVVYTPNLLSQSFVVLTTAAERTLYSVSAKDATSVLIAGADAHLEMRMGTSAAPAELLVPPVRDLHFTSASTGTYLADNFVIRTTATGGSTWNVVYPDAPQAPTHTYRKVWTKSASESYVLGDNTQYRISASALATPVTISGDAVANVKAVAQGTTADELHVITNGTIVKFNLATQVATHLVTPANGADANALHVFRNGSYLVVGENGFYRHYDAANTLLDNNPSELAGNNLNDLVFTDNITGTVVGDNGAYFTTTNPAIDPDGYLTSVDWKQKAVTASSDPLGATAMDIYTIDFAAPTSGAFAGTYPSGGPFTHPYVRKVFDASERYSSRFFYDRLGRLVVSQNARQYNGPERKFSYTRYDALGRVIEAGEKTENSGADLRFSGIFGTSVSNFFNPGVIDDSLLQAWIEASGARMEVTRSYYDSTTIAGLPAEFDTDRSTQNKRIVHVTYEEEYDGDDQTYDHATHYRYDLHGNVKTLLQDNRKMAVTYPSIAAQRFKRMDYAYDLVSGNVHRMSVQSGQPDQWHHAFVYDADNRITHVYTSTTTPLVRISGLAQDMQNELETNSDWQNDARYFYYDHGPLARVEIGQNNLQGVDYYYTLQGWLKGVNSSVLDDEHDPGKDSDPSSVNALFAKDVFGFGLQYYTGDYAAIGSATPQAAVNSSSHAAANSHDLYNGNIRSMQTTLTNPQTREAMPMLNAYKYDQLNRLVESRSYENGLSANVWNPTSYANAYFNAFTYDASGNILTQKRHKRDGTEIEDLTYQYRKNTDGKILRNRLYHINDSIADGIDATDIDDQGVFEDNPLLIETSNNYVRDEQGRLIKNVQEEIDTIIWTVTDKVKEIRRTGASIKKNVIFDYDALGNQIAKHVYNNQTDMLEKSTYYILDAQGQQMSMYEHEVDTAEVKYYLKERSIYGSAVLGSIHDTINLYNPQLLPSYGVTGNRYYQMNEHRGNVLAVINDKIIPLSSNSTTVDAYQAGIVNVGDFSPFGVELDGRTIKNDFYRRSFQNQEHHDEINGEGRYINYKYRGYDPLIGRLDWMIDPLAYQYPHNSPYAFSENVVINAVELEGLEKFETIVVQSSVDPQLKVIHVRKTSETTDNGKPLEVNYIYKDASLNVIKSVIQDHFVEGSAEEYAMNRDYQNSGTNQIQAMNVTELTTNPNTGKTSMKVRKDANGNDIRNTLANGNKSSIVAQTVFQYDLRILFKPNKAGITPQELQDGTYNKAMSDIEQFKQTLSNLIPVSFHQGSSVLNYDLTNFQMIVNGETDSQPSTPPFPSVNGLPEGNPSLGQKRADNLLQLLEGAHPNKNKTNVINHSGTVKSRDRNSSIFFTN